MMSDYYDGYREGMAQASRETAALREQLDAMLNSVADMKSLMMPPPPIHLTIPSVRKPMTEEELRKAFLSTNTAEPLCEGWPGLERFARAIERHHGVGGDDEK